MHTKNLRICIFVTVTATLSDKLLCMVASISNFFTFEIFPKIDQKMKFFQNVIKYPFFLKLIPDFVESFVFVLVSYCKNLNLISLVYYF